MNKFPDIISVFPLSNFIMFPNTTVPLNIFEPRYIDMINDSMKNEKLIGMIQPNYKDNRNNTNPELYEIGCLGKITSFQETENGNFLIELKGLIRFKILEEIKTSKKYRSCKVNYNGFKNDLINTVDWTYVAPELSNPSDENTAVFREYEYLIGGKGGQLNAFIKFQLKIVMTSTNSAKVPMIKDLRAIALSV